MPTCFLLSCQNDDVRRSVGDSGLILLIGAGDGDVVLLFTIGEETSTFDGLYPLAPRTFLSAVSTMFSFSIGLSICFVPMCSILLTFLTNDSTCCSAVGVRCDDWPDLNLVRDPQALRQPADSAVERRHLVEQRSDAAAMEERGIQHCNDVAARHFHLRLHARHLRRARQE
jgi:hypothetical protein